MRCDHAMSLVDAYADDEVRGWTRLRVRSHLRTCPGCAARLDETLALKTRIKAEAPRFVAPAGLRMRVSALRDAALAAHAPRRGVDRRWWWAGGGALAGSALTMMLGLGIGTIGTPTSDDIAIAAVDAHARATLRSHLTDVASSDQHTVKPWLSARLDYSPPVRDFARDGFTLVGARIDRLQGRPVATLVYRYRDHTVDVFVRPEPMRIDSNATRSVRGFNVVYAEGLDMAWLVVSDASVESLAPLVRDLTSR